MRQHLRSRVVVHASAGELAGAQQDRLDKAIAAAVKAKVIKPIQTSLPPYHLLQVLNAEDNGHSAKGAEEAELISALRSVIQAPKNATAEHPPSPEELALVESVDPPSPDLVPCLVLVLEHYADSSEASASSAVQHLPSLFASATLGVLTGPRGASISQQQLSTALAAKVFALSSFAFAGEHALSATDAALLLLCAASLGLRPPIRWVELMVARSEPIRCMAPGAADVVSKRDLQLGCLWATLHLKHKHITRRDGEAALQAALSHELPCPEVRGGGGGMAAWRMAHATRCHSIWATPICPYKSTWHAAWAWHLLQAQRRKRLTCMPRRL